MIFDKKVLVDRVKILKFQYETISKSLYELEKQKDDIENELKLLSQALTFFYKGDKNE